MAAESTTLVLPLLALIVALVVNSVRDRDPIYYRLFVGVFSLVALTFTFTVLALTSSFFEVPPALVGTIIAVTYLFMLLLLSGSLYMELTRGLNDRDKQEFQDRLFWWVQRIIVIGVVMFILFIIIGARLQ